MEWKRQDGARPEPGLGIWNRGLCNWTLNGFYTELLTYHRVFKPLELASHCIFVCHEKCYDSKNRILTPTKIHIGNSSFRVPTGINVGFPTAPLPPPPPSSLNRTWIPFNLALGYAGKRLCFSFSITCLSRAVLKKKRKKKTSSPRWHVTNQRKTWWFCVVRKEFQHGRRSSAWRFLEVHTGPW